MTAHNLPIEYRKSAPMGVVGTDPYNFLIYDKFFDDFKVIVEEDQAWLHDIPLNGDVAIVHPPKSGDEGIARLMRSPRFVQLFKNDSKRKFVMYSPIDPPYKINPLAYLMNSPTIAHAYENKRYFRDEFADLIKMPDYEIRYMNELDKAASFSDLRERFGGAFILQDEDSSGSKGTYPIHDHEDYVRAVKSLKKYSRGRTIVASEFIHGEVSSIQVCITKYGIFSGGIQRQLLDSKYLCNPNLEGASKWCGGEVGAAYPDIVQHQAREIASVVGSELASHGYKGIFGIDLIVTPENEVYTIEINARLTGYSHIISDLQLMEGKIPFMMLHALELGNFNYEVTDSDALPSNGVYKKPASLLIVNNPLDEEFVLQEYIRPGVYKLDGDKVTFLRPATSVDSLRNEDTFILLSRHTAGSTIGRGKRMLKIMKIGKTMHKGDLTPKTRQIVKAVKYTFGLPE
jgi:hypothetical protein